MADVFDTLASRP